MDEAPFGKRKVNTSLVLRTRLGWALVALLLVSTLVLSSAAMVNIQRTQRVLSDTAIPALNTIESVSAAAADLNRAFDDLANAPDETTRTLALGEAALTIERIEGLGQQDDKILQWLGQMKSALNQVDIAGARVLQIREDIRQSYARVSEHSKQLGEKIAALNTESGLEIEAIILADETRLGREKLAASIHDLNLSVQIKTMFERELDLTSLLLNVRSHIQLAELEKRLTFNLRAIINSLISLTDNSQKNQLAQSLTLLRIDLLGDSGLIALERNRLDLEQTLADALLDASRTLKVISEHANSGVLEAQAGILQAAASINETINRTLFWLTLLAVVICVLVFPATMLFVERRVVLRLKELALSVREIAAGNTDWKVTVTGKDEFGEMAQALDTFKGNLMELHRSNEELGRFAYAASHDLKSPLRAIHDLAQWTIEDCGDQMPEDGLENLTMIIKRSERLSNLLTDLLDYSRLGREEHAVEDIDAIALTDEIAEILGAKDSFEFSVTGNVSVVKTYLAPLRQILLNFITNAIKHHDQGKGLIVVDFHSVGSRLRISVTDDGPGIDPEFHERIFGLFQTLKSRDEVEGSGMGLAFIRKQVEQYGGGVTVRSDPARSRGTTFIFDWPQHEIEHNHPQAA